MAKESAAPIEVASRTDVGLQRAQNQDSFGAWVDGAGRQLLLVADGMGGHQGGATASRMAVDVIGQCFAQGVGEPAAQLLERAFAAANRAIHGAARSDASLHGMGTTGVAVLIDVGAGALRAVAAHVGDSRLYRLRQARLELLTRDHSVCAERMARTGVSAEEAARLPHSSALLRALGPEPHVEVEIQDVAVEPGDVFLLCTDGLWGLRPPEALAAVLGQYPPADAARILIDEANRFGGSDNITVQIASVAAAPRAACAEPAATRGPRTAVRRAPRLWLRTAKGALAAGSLLAGAGLIALRLQTPAMDGMAEQPSAGLPVRAAVRAERVAGARAQSRSAAAPARGTTEELPAGAAQRAAQPGAAALEMTPARHSRAPRETGQAALFAGLREHLAGYERALRACDLPALRGIASEPALARAHAQCRRGASAGLRMNVSEASLRELGEGRFALDVEEWDGTQRSELRAVLQRGPAGAWQLADLAPRSAAAPAEQP